MVACDVFVADCPARTTLDLFAHTLVGDCGTETLPADRGVSRLVQAALVRNLSRGRR